MINPLDALSALTQAQLPSTTGAAGAPGLGALPSGAASPVGESFQNLIPSLLPTNGVSPVTPPTTAAVTPLISGGGAPPANWEHMVQQMVLDVNSKQQNATNLVTDVLKGGPTPVHEAMVASEEASLSFEFLSEMRNKVVEAYQQVMQMQV